MSNPSTALEPLVDKLVIKPHFGEVFDFASGLAQKVAVHSTKSGTNKVSA